MECQKYSNETYITRDKKLKPTKKTSRQKQIFKLKDYVKTIKIRTVNASTVLQGRKSN